MLTTTLASALLHLSTTCRRPLTTAGSRAADGRLDVLVYLDVDTLVVGDLSRLGALAKRFNATQWAAFAAEDGSWYAPESNFLPASAERSLATLARP